jgi:hypothetical protein
VAVVAALGASAFGAASPASAASRSKAGRSGPAITLGHHVSMTSDTADIAIDKNNTAYVSWISEVAGENDGERTIKLCVLPSGARACKGGIQTTDALGDSSAADLQVLIVNGTPTIFWIYDTLEAGTNPEGAAVAAATVTPTGVLNPGVVVTAAPSHDSLLDVAVAPNGQIWTITYGSALDTFFEVREGLTATPVTVHTPFYIERAQVAWDHGKAIIAIAKGGSTIGEPAFYSASSGTTFPAFKSVKNTWTVGTDVGLVKAGSHVRLVAAVGNASYEPAVATWTGSSFTKAKSNGDHGSHGKYPGSHDVNTDPSGRMVDAEDENGVIAVSNYANDKTAAVYRFSTGGTDAGPQPQIATTSRGNGWVLWAVEDSASGGYGDFLRVVPIRLSDTHQTAQKHGKHGRVTLTGPSSCLPAVSISDHVKGAPKHGWKVTKKTVKLAGNTIGGTVNGAALTGGKTYHLTGTVVFTSKSSGAHSSATATLKFKSCSN